YRVADHVDLHAFPPRRSSDLMGPLRRRPRRVLKDVVAEARHFRTRVIIAFVGVTLALVGLALGYYRLQVWHHDEYATRAEQNRRSEEHTSELQSRENLVCRLL